MEAVAWPAAVWVRADQHPGTKPDDRRKEQAMAKAPPDPARTATAHQVLQILGT